jgi:glycosyltransferase involved in cell wall biosynthesis
MTHPMVSVIVPAFNSEASLPAALLSIAQQSVKPLEVLVIDDGSSDGTMAVAKSCAGEMQGIDVILLSQDRKGPGAARNLGLAKARGELVAFLDADDSWLPEKIERSLAQMQDRVLVAHDFIEVCGGRETLRDPSRHFLSAPDPYAALFLRCYIATSTVMARREAVLAAGGFAEDLPAAQDYDLWLRLLGQPGARFAILPEALMRYAVSPSGITSKAEQRRVCSMEALRRNLHRHKAGALMTSLKRVLIIHYEALGAGLQRRRPLDALPGLACLPLDLAEMLAKAIGAPLLIAHGLVVYAAYLAVNRDYYAEKIAVFSRFLLERVL